MGYSECDEPVTVVCIVNRLYDSYTVFNFGLPAHNNPKGGNLMAKAQQIGGFQVEVVTDVPKVSKTAVRGIYAELIEKVPEDSTQALKIDIGDAKKASTKVSGLKGFLKRHNRVEEFTVVRRQSVIFISRATVAEAE